MKKILSIILALGLVLSMSLAAMPTVAQTCTATAVPDSPCAGATTFYTITFTSPATLLAGNDILSFSFGAGTTFATPAGAVTISVDGGAAITVPAATVVRAAPDIEFLLPAGASIDAGDIVVVVIAGVTNPAEGEYTMGLSYKFACCDPVVFNCAEYIISPAQSSYKFVIDFNKDPANEPYETLWGGDAIDNFYTGIGEGFIPPFGFCELTAFNLWLRYDGIAGCFGYDDVIINVELCDAPPGGVVTIWLYGWHGDPATLDWHEFTLDEDDEDAQDFLWGFAPDGFFLAPNHDESAPGVIHFSIPGDYCICVTLIDLAPEAGVCEDPEEDKPLADAEFCATVYQILDSFPVDPFTPKWNFFSSPLILKDGDIEAVLAPVIDEGQLRSVVHYDNMNDKWSAFHSNSGLDLPYQSLTMIVDGKGYAVRMKADYEVGFVASTQVLWLFGNVEPEFPAPPLNYKVYEGWTMMGFTSIATMTAADYLNPSVPTVNAVWTIGGFVTDMDPGFGYWVYFNQDGYVVPDLTP